MSEGNPWSLFGIDLRQSMQFLQLGFRQILWADGIGLRSRFYAPALLHDTDQVTRPVSEYGEVPAAIEPAISAYLLPDDLYLVRELQVPDAVEGQLDELVAMELAGFSPFPAEDLCFGWRIVARDHGNLRVVVALASRVSVVTWLHNNPGSSAVALEDAEVWASVDERNFIVFEGFGEAKRRYDYYAALKALGLRSLVVAGLLVLALMIPVIASAVRAHQFDDYLADTRESARGATRLREQLQGHRDDLMALDALRAKRRAYHYWLNTLSAMAPDSVHFSRIEFDGAQVEVSGMAENAAAFLSQLADSGRFEAIAAPGTFTRNPRSGLERFIITLDIPAVGAEAP